MEEPPVSQKIENYIKLDRFLKFVRVTSTGGQAKMMVQMGMVSVNGELETRRGRKLVAGDRVEVEGQTFVVSPDLVSR